MSLVEVHSKRGLGLPPEGDFHYIKLWSVPHPEASGVMFPELGVGVRIWRGSWEWRGDKPSDETLALLVLALR